MDVAFHTPVSQRLVGRLRLVLVPPLQRSLGLEQILESRVSAFAPEIADDLVVAMRKLARGKSQCKTLPEVELGLVR